MKQTVDLHELKKFAMRLAENGEKGQTFINQANHNREESLLSDEDTAGRHTLQVLRIVIQTKNDSIYFEYVFNEPIELEEMNVQLEEVYAKFPKNIVTVKEMNDLVR